MIFGGDTDPYFISFDELHEFLMQVKYEYEDFIDAWFMFRDNVEFIEVIKPL
jgi:hypothetical protein